jgi:hypothetical protein
MLYSSEFQTVDLWTSLYSDKLLGTPESFLIFNIYEAKNKQALKYLLVPLNITVIKQLDVSINNILLK